METRRDDIEKRQWMLMGKHGFRPVTLLRISDLWISCCRGILLLVLLVMSPLQSTSVWTSRGRGASEQ